MEEIQDEKNDHISRIAVEMVEQYVEGLLSVTTLKERIRNELPVEELSKQREGPIEPRTYKRIAQRICSRTLCMAWRSPDSYLKERAFANMRHYLERILSRSSYVVQWPHTSHSLEDVLHETLETLYALSKRENGGPDDPDCFLKWTQTIAVRQAYAFAERTKHTNTVSFENNCELFSEQFVEKSEPLKEVLVQELRDTLIDALTQLRNTQYRQVLFYTYLLHLDGTEVAKKMGVQVQEVYTWHRRALIALRKRPEIIHLLKSIRE